MVKSLERTYYSESSPAAFTGINNLARVTKRSRKDVEEFLHAQNVWSLHKPITRRFKRRKILAPGALQSFHIDLSDMQKLKRWNDGFSWILVAVDVGTRMMYAVPTKTKSASDILQALESVFSEFTPTMVATDRGKEWYNSTVQSFFRQNHITHFSTFNDDVHCSIAEAGIKRLKMRLYKYFSHKGTNRYLEMLPKIVRSLNCTFIKSIGRAPKDMDDAAVIAQEAPPPRKEKPRFEVGDVVRISRAPKHFSKGYTQTHTHERFIVIAVHNHSDPPYYHLSALDGTHIRGCFYEQEMAICTAPEDNDDFIRFEKIIAKRTINGQEESLIKVLGKKQQYWIPSTDLILFK